MNKIESFNAVILHSLSVLQMYLYNKSSNQSPVDGNHSSRCLDHREAVCSRFKRNRRHSERRIEYSGDAGEARIPVAAREVSARRAGLCVDGACEAVRSVEGAGGECVGRSGTEDGDYRHRRECIHFKRYVKCLLNNHWRDMVVKLPNTFRQNWSMNKRNRAQVRLMRDYEEIQNDPPYVYIESELWL